MRLDHSHLASYQRQAGAAFRAITGLSLGDVRGDHERLPGAVTLMRASASGLDPAAYASGVAARCGFIPGDAPDADIRNATILRLVAHCAGDPDWLMGMDGCAYREDAQGVVRVSAHDGDEPDTSFGVDVARSPFGSLASHGGIAVPQGTAFETLSRGMDIDEALDGAPAPRMS